MELDLVPGVVLLPDRSCVVGLMPVEPETLEYVAHWAAGSLPSAQVRAQAGILATAFTIEEHDCTAYLIPEWWVAFYVNGEPARCVPTLAMRAVLDDPRFGDWVPVAMERMVHFGLSPGSTPIDELRAHNVHTI